MISAAEQQLVGCPLPAVLVARMDAILSRVAMFLSAGMSELRSTDTKTSEAASVPRLNTRERRRSVIRHSARGSLGLVKRKKIDGAGEAMLPINQGLESQSLTGKLSICGLVSIFSQAC